MGLHDCKGQTHTTYFGTSFSIVANKCAVAFWFVCFALERRDLTLVESVTLKLGPCNSYGGDFSYIYFQMQIEPYSNTFGLPRNSGSVPLLEHVPYYLVKLGCALLAWSSSIFQGDFFP